MKTLKLSEIRIDGGTQARASLDQATVMEYSEHMKEGAKFPAPIVFFDGSEYWMADGFHRYFAHKSNGALEISCDVKEGTQRDAQFYAMGANGGRGLKWRSEDVKKIIATMLQDEEWGKMSASAIAKHVGVSVMTVSRVRHALQESQQEPEENDEEDEVTEPSVTYTTKHGTKSKMKTENLGKKPKNEKPAKKEKKAVEPSPPEELPEVQELKQQLQEAADVVSGLEAENTKLKDAIAIGQWDATDIEKVDVQDTIAALREEIRIKNIEIESLRVSRDTYQNRAAELMKQVKYLQGKLKKAGIE